MNKKDKEELQQLINNTRREFSAYKDSLIADLLRFGAIKEGHIEYLIEAADETDEHFYSSVTALEERVHGGKE